MKLLIVSHTAHYHKEGMVVGWGATVREIDQLARVFDEVVHLAPLHLEPAPDSALPYDSDHVHLASLPPVGGPRLSDKLGIVRRVPLYIRAIWRELPHADVVHIRCPANISLLAVILLAFARYPRLRWIKYAGNWNPEGEEPLSYTFQRWWLKRGWHRGQITVNGEWPDSPPFVHSFFNPCITEEEILYGRHAARNKELNHLVRLLFVGRIEAAKGIERILAIAERLTTAGIDFEIDLVGDGPQRPLFESLAKEQRIDTNIHFHGWLPRNAINAFYVKSHFVLFPSRSEGWPKVLSEAMAYGVVPLASNVSSIPQFLSEFETGRALDPQQTEAFIDAILWYIDNPECWREESRRGVEAAEMFTYKAYLNAVRKLLDLR